MKTTKTKASKPKTKTEFILLHPDAPAKDIIAKGRTLGFALTEKYIYTTRSLARARQARGATRGAASGSLRGKPHELLLAVAAEVGLAKAIDILSAERRKVLEALGR